MPRACSSMAIPRVVVIPERLTQRDDPPLGKPPLEAQAVAVGGGTAHHRGIRGRPTAVDQEASPLFQLTL
jgi:hypothetical protein